MSQYPPPVSGFVTFNDNNLCRSIKFIEAVTIKYKIDTHRQLTGKIWYFTHSLDQHSQPNSTSISLGDKIIDNSIIRFPGILDITVDLSVSTM